MPTYEYRCRDCGHSFDIVQKMSDDALTHCPECGGELRKVFAPPAISFKGSGFYATDHGKKSKSASGEPKKDAAPASGDSKADAKGDSKAGTKKDSKSDSSSGSDSPASAAKKEGST
jgi:putative FmdB family regulatory protein